MARLHILNKPPSHPRFKACLAGIGPSDAIVLIEHGVIGIRALTEQVGNDVKVYALEADLEARGLQAVASAASDTISIIDYRGMVDVAAAYPDSVSW